MTQMLLDLELSDAINSEFRVFAKAMSDAGMVAFSDDASYHGTIDDLTVAVLTSGTWPQSKNEEKSQVPRIPNIMQTAMDGFSAWYSNKHNSR